MRGLGRIPSPVDERDWKLANFMFAVPEAEIRKSRIWRFIHKTLDQGETPHCCGFSCASFGVNYPVHTNYTNADGDRFYYVCKEIDGEPKEENGSTIRSVAKALKKEGRINAYAFAATPEEIRWWILYRGPVIVGTEWTYDMFDPDKKHHVVPTGSVAGGHAYLLNGYTPSGYFRIQNSWGDTWGLKGRAYIKFEDFSKLFANGGEAMTAVELPK